MPFLTPQDGTTSFVLQSVTISATATTILGTTESSSAVTNITPIEHIDTVMATQDTVGLCNPADDTNFSRTFTWTPDMNATVYKVALILAAAVNVSAYTNGTVTLGRVSVSAVERLTGRNLIPNISVNNITTGLTATGTAIEIIMADWTQGFAVYSKSPIDITVSIPSTRSGTNTSQTGYLPVFCFNKANVAKQWTQSGIWFHVHASADHADEALSYTPDRVSTLGQ